MAQSPLIPSGSDPLQWEWMTSPWGRFWLGFSQSGLRTVRWKTPNPSDQSVKKTIRIEKKTIEQAKSWFNRYFLGSKLVLLPKLDLSGATPFQHRVWEALQGIPWGQVRSYLEIARAIGQPDSARAVGLANHLNPLPIIIPCHRVIRHSWEVGGYRMGTGNKERLLSHEGVVIIGHRVVLTQERPLQYSISTFNENICSR